MSKKPDRLFTNLTFLAFDDYVLRGKRVEVRKAKGSFAPEKVISGRRVELVRAYSRGSIWGVIGRVVIGKLSDVVHAFPLEKIEPRFSTYEAAIQDNLTILGESLHYIAFEVILDELKQAHESMKFGE